MADFGFQIFLERKENVPFVVFRHLTTFFKKIIFPEKSPFFEHFGLKREFLSLDGHPFGVFSTISYPILCLLNVTQTA